MRICVSKIIQFIPIGLEVVQFDLWRLTESLHVLPIASPDRADILELIKNFVVPILKLLTPQRRREIATW